MLNKIAVSMGLIYSLHFIRSTTYTDIFIDVQTLKKVITEYVNHGINRRAILLNNIDFNNCVV